jgi:hypothetical protein
MRTFLLLVLLCPLVARAEKIDPPADEPAAPITDEVKAECTDPICWTRPPDREGYAEELPTCPSWQPREDEVVYTMTNTNNPQLTQAPEPGTLSIALLGAGLLTLRLRRATRRPAGSR